ncbi:type 2 lanthipeptide synthetase LanM family protein [Parafrankia sp. EUN1f]|uniref:type 2 lanthipeptide synthetase LanM family protein n=1 Tax=Parafrankia sp. EUN1f TaxID=102897 RepID=UPI0001C47044|nr:type 2 lanthipeptide synthetase LanM family protein [Parafrankia sp. EUN1f]EFC80456.1 Lanthionine synthetase C family protein [Parafrankia sp. EUN1f]
MSPERALDTWFPLDIACRASNLREQTLLVASLRSWQPPAGSPHGLSEVDRWKVGSLADRLAAQHLKDSHPATTPHRPDRDELVGVLERFRTWALHLGDADEESRKLLAGMHGSWLPNYRAALEASDPADGSWAQTRPRPPDGSARADVARACEPFLAHLRRKLGRALDSANRAGPAEAFAPEIADGVTAHFLDRFELALAWAVEADANVWRARSGNDHDGTAGQHERYLSETFAGPRAYHGFYLHFPVLGRWLAQVSGMLGDNGQSLIGRLQRDREAIGDVLLGDEILRFRSVRLGMSDSHAGGQTVALVTADLARSGQGTFVYKPRCVHSQAALQGLLERLAKDGVAGFATYRTLERDGYGYEALIPSGRNHAASPAEVTAIYEEVGGYLGVFHALGGSDLHFENVLVADGHAYVCDAETALDVLPRGATRAAGTVIDSVYRTGLLEWPLPPTAEVAMRMSGTSGGESYSLPFAVPRIRRRATTGLAVRHETGVHVQADPANRVWLDGELVGPEAFRDAIVSGFTAVHDWFASRPAKAARQVSELFDGASIRFVSRSTQIYGQLLVAARHPRCLREPLEVDLVIGRLREQAPQWDRDGVLTDREARSLWQLDIPIFTTDARGRLLTADHADTLPVQLRLSPVELAAQRIRGLSAEDRLRQVQYIAASLSSSEVHSPAFVGSALDHSGLIGRELREMLGDGSDPVPWKRYEIADGRAGTAGVQADLYHGSAGVALFLAYLDSVAPQEGVREAAERALRHALTHHDRHGIGAFTGVSGLIYVLTHLHGLWKDATLLDRAVELTALIDDGVRGDRTFDVLGGSAGAIPVLIGLADACGTGLGQAQRCARHLLDHAERTRAGLSWAPLQPGDAAANLTGFAHGAAGIGWALIMLGTRTGREEYIEAGMEAFRYEKSHFDEAEQDWYDLRASIITMYPGRRHFTNVWCAGAAGIGLSRISSWAALGRSDEGLLGEAYIALRATLRNFQGLGNDTLCHGRSGNAELLLRFARLCEEPPFQLEANVQAQGQWRRLAGDPAWLRRDGDVPAYPGLMIGLAGTGMHFLRLAHPDRVPSPLLLDPPPLLPDHELKGAQPPCPPTPVPRSSTRPGADLSYSRPSER